MLVLLGVLLVAWTLVAEPIIGLAQDRQSEIATLSDRLVKLRRVNARIPVLREQVTKLQAKIQAEGGLWPGPSEASVSTGMQSKLRDALTGKQGNIRSTAEMQSAYQVGLRVVRVHVVIDGTLETLVHTLTTIETTRPPMFVDNLKITAPAHITVDKSPMLVLDIDVVGYMRKPAQ